MIHFLVIALVSVVVVLVVVGAFIPAFQASDITVGGTVYWVCPFH